MVADVSFFLSQTCLFLFPLRNHLKRMKFDASAEKVGLSADLDRLVQLWKNNSEVASVGVYLCRRALAGQQANLCLCR